MNRAEILALVRDMLRAGVTEPARTMVARAVALLTEIESVVTDKPPRKGTPASATPDPILQMGDTTLPDFIDFERPDGKKGSHGYALDVELDGMATRLVVHDEGQGWAISDPLSGIRLGTVREADGTPVTGTRSIGDLVRLSVAMIARSRNQAVLWERVRTAREQRGKRSKPLDLIA